MSKPSTFSSDSPSDPWWAVLIEGIAMVILGISWLAVPKMTTTVTLEILGIYWIFAGILGIIIVLIFDRSKLRLKLFIGILGIITGFVVFLHPRWSMPIVGATLVIIVSVAGLIFGGTRIYEAFKGAGLGAGILGILSMLFGLVLLFNVWVATLALPSVLGVLAIAGGIVSIVMAFRLK